MLGAFCFGFHFRDHVLNVKDIFVSAFLFCTGLGLALKRRGILTMMKSCRIHYPLFLIIRFKCFLAGPLPS